jgi:hypothetical protein
MKPYLPYREEAFFIETATNTYAVKFRGVLYRDTADLTALGVLLFGLRPAGFDYRCKSDPEISMRLMQNAAYILHFHANNDRFVPTGERRIDDEDLRDWVARAVELAPDADSTTFVRKCVDEALGPYAYLIDAELERCVLHD